MAFPADGKMFEIAEATIQQYHEALLSGETSCEAVVSAYLDRISSLDKVLRSVIHLSPHSIAQARELDHRLLSTSSTKNGLPPLFGVPMVLKDTYGTSDLPTTAGSKSLIGLQTDDAFVVRKLRRAGAIILGKTNCSEFCVGGCTCSSLGGQTLNPYDLTRTPGGSSGGTAVALAANLAMVGCGADTVNSIRSPASACNIVGLRPSAGQISRTGIFPCAVSQDAAGPMARTVRDVRVLFEVMRGEDPEYVATSSREEAPTLRAPRTLLNTKPRVGILESYFPDADENEDAGDVLAVMHGALHRLEGRVELVPVPAHDLGDDQIGIANLAATIDVQRFEFATSVRDFMSSPHVRYTPHKSLRSIADSGDYNRDALGDVFFQTLEPGQDARNPEYPRRQQRMKSLHDSLVACLDKHDVDAVVFPHQRRLVVKAGARAQPDRNGLLAALTGCPSLCIPAGFSPPSEHAPLGVPVGMEVLGRRGDDLLLLEIGEVMTAVLDSRKAPAST